jgi:hypothetical protein
MAAGAVDSILVPSWGINDATYRAISETRELVPETVSVGAYVSVLPPVDLPAVPAHVAALVDSGADELHLYHLGLAASRQLQTVGAVARFVSHVGSGQ